MSCVYFLSSDLLSLAQGELKVDRNGTGIF